MKKIFILFPVLLLSTCLVGQTISLSFYGVDSLTMTPVSLDSVLVRNTTAGCDTVLYGSAPSVTLTNSLGIGDLTETEPVLGSPAFLPAWPNPFSGTTTVPVFIHETGEFVFRIQDVSGKVLAENEAALSKGLHYFMIGSSKSGLLLLSLSDGREMYAVKLVSQGTGTTGSFIRYTGMRTGSIKSNAIAERFIFRFGDQLMFLSHKEGYNGVVMYDTPVQDSGYTLIMTPAIGYLPFVLTTGVTGITLYSAKAGGDVTWDGGSAVTAKGVCYSESPEPDLTDNYTLDGWGTGPFVSHLTGLEPGTIYYIRAYATNDAGTAYGEEVSFLSGQQVENPGFEYWEDAIASVIEPVDWSSIKSCDDGGIGSMAPVTAERSDDAHSGSYAVKLFNVSIFNTTVTGALTNGIFHVEFNFDSSYAYTKADDARWHTPFASRPDSLTGWFKYYPQGNDAAQVRMILHAGEGKIPENGTAPNWVAMAEFQTLAGVTYGTWNRFSVPFDYYSDEFPEYLLCVISSSFTIASVEGSYLIIDDLEVVYNSEK